MKSITLIALFAVIFVASVSAMPPAEMTFEEAANLDPVDEEAFGTSIEEHSARIARATCDLLSVDTPFGSLNHSACAAHCLALRRGFRGGRCQDGVCHCRR